MMNLYVILIVCKIVIISHKTVHACKLDCCGNQWVVEGLCMGDSSSVKSTSNQLIHRIVISLNQNDSPHRIINGNKHYHAIVHMNDSTTWLI